MNILGITLSQTSFGKPLKDGGAALVQDGRLMGAIAEERLTGEKYCGGFRASASSLLDSAEVDAREIDLVAYSSCCDSPIGQASVAKFEVSDFAPNARLLAVPHHLSHAFAAFMTSPFEEAVVCVIDAGGDILGSSRPEWWLCHREQHSYYLATRQGMTMIGRDFTDPSTAGFGETYRAFTHFLGFGSYVHSEKTMALAAYSEFSVSQQESLFRMGSAGFLEGGLQGFNPNEPSLAVEELLGRRGWKEAIRRNRTEEFSQVHIDAARLLQESLELALVEKVAWLTESTGVRNVCLAGGVALNCLANRRLLMSGAVDRLYVQPAAGDQGQCLGNVLVALHQNSYPINGQVFDPFLGPSSTGSNCDYSADAINSIASVLASGGIVAWFQGRSEFGPRALGNRSLLAHPGRSEVLPRLKQIKGRYEFCPFAPSILEERASEFMEDCLGSPYMTVAGSLKPKWRRQLRSIMHVDGSSRPQLVSRELSPTFYMLIERFEKLTGLPLVLNTSLNQADSPIIEREEDAIRFATGSGVDAVYMNGKVLMATDLQTSHSSQRLGRAE